MSTTIRPELGRSNKYHISKHRFYELKHFCLQYYEWISKHDTDIPSSVIRELKSTDKADIVLTKVLHDDIFISNENLVELCAELCDPVIGPYIFKAVTEDLSFINLKTVYDIPCERDMYYDRYRKFFWILSYLKK